MRCMQIVYTAVSCKYMCGAHLSVCHILIYIYIYTHLHINYINLPHLNSNKPPPHLGFYSWCSSINFGHLDMSPKSPMFDQWFGGWIARVWARKTDEIRWDYVDNTHTHLIYKYLYSTCHCMHPMKWLNVYDLADPVVQKHPPRAQFSLQAAAKRYKRDWNRTVELK